MKIWLDDIRPASSCGEWAWCKSVNQVISQIIDAEYMYNASRRKDFWTIELIDIAHDMIEEYIELTEWFRKTGRNYSINIH